ncbi:MAG: hypothetical protein KC478_04115 [Bacteriovoracaceae bacterium]|nr:hypothetical protein [Bacteriovoracaceae bacterium]
MKSIKFKILLPVILVTVAFVAKLVLWDFAISTGKRTGNLVKLSKKGKVFKTWEGTLDLGSGDLLTFDFSVRDEKLADEMYSYEGKTVSIYYEETFAGWPWETKYNVIEWNRKDKRAETVSLTPVAKQGEALNLLNKTMFCSTLGSLYSDQDLYKKVKAHLKGNNLYLYRQIEKCND